MVLTMIKPFIWVWHAVHGGEFEGIVGMVNLISVIETGKDLRGREWPGIIQQSFQRSTG